MAQLWTNKYVRVNEYTRPGIKLGSVRKIVVHWTANPGASAANHFRYFDGTAIASKRYASAHIFVDRTEALCIVPLTEVAYHANDGSYRGVPALKPNANMCSVGVEMCLEKDGTIHAETIAKTAEVVADLCRTYKLTAADIVRHYDVTHKSCPTPWVAKPAEFEAFKATVGKLLVGGTPVKASAEAVKPSDTKAYRLATGCFGSKASMAAGKAALSQKFGWIVYERESDLRLLTGTFTGRNVAEANAARVAAEFGWQVYVKEA